MSCIVPRYAGRSADIAIDGVVDGPSFYECANGILLDDYVPRAGCSVDFYVVEAFCVIFAWKVLDSTIAPVDRTEFDS